MMEAGLSKQRKLLRSQAGWQDKEAGLSKQCKLLRSQASCGKHLKIAMLHLSHRLRGQHGFRAGTGIACSDDGGLAVETAIAGAKPGVLECELEDRHASSQP